MLKPGQTIVHLVADVAYDNEGEYPYPDEATSLITTLLGVKFDPMTEAQESEVIAALDLLTAVVVEQGIELARKDLEVEAENQVADVQAYERDLL